jgi:hypothetical protein
MKKITMSAFIAMSVLSSIASAQDTIIDSVVEKMYVGVALITENTPDNKSGTALSLTVGAPIFEDADKFIGILGVDFDITQTITPTETEKFLGSWTEASYTNVALYATWRYDFDASWYIKPRAGMLYSMADFKVKGAVAGSAYAHMFESADNDELTVALSILGGYKIDKNLEVLFGLYDNDSLMPFDNYYTVGAGVNWNF